MKSCFLLIEVLCCPKQRHDGLLLDMTVNEFNTDSVFLRALPSLASVYEHIPLFCTSTLFPF